MCSFVVGGVDWLGGASQWAGEVEYDCSAVIDFDKGAGIWLGGGLVGPSCVYAGAAATSGTRNIKETLNAP